MIPPRFDLCIIPAAGQGTRMGELCQETPKCLLLVNGKPILQHILEYWWPMIENNGRGIIVLTPWKQKEQIRDAVHSHAEFMPTPVSLNLPQAIAYAMESAGIFYENRHVLVILGDCLIEGTFAWEHLTQAYNGIGVVEGDTDFSRSYVVQALGGRVKRVVEKPFFCGMGVYALQVDTIPILNRSAGITEAVGTIAKSKGVQIVPFTGRYLNITYPEDLRRWA